jgi:AraC-like DNA-binding protein
MEALLSPALFSIPLLGHDWLRRTTVDPQAWAQAVCATTPVRICEPQQIALPFRNDAAILPLGQVVVVATQGSAITLVTEQHPFAQLLIPYRGWGLWKLENAGYENPFGESVLYLPPAPLSLQNDTTSGVALNLDPATLVATALTMAGPEGLPPHRLSVFQQPKRLLMGDPGCAPLIHGLYSLLSTLNQLTATPGTDVASLRLDDVLNRMVVLLLLPELLRDPPSTRAQETAAEAQGKLQQLLDWIDAHLDSPMGLSDLEAQAHWSRRSLQYAFQSACGCSPMQWVRRRRLQRAMQRLKNPQPGDSVSSIARSVGFASSVSFGRDFRRLYGCTPSSLLRQTVDAGSVRA